MQLRESNRARGRRQAVAPAASNLPAGTATPEALPEAVARAHDDAPALGNAWLEKTAAAFYLVNLLAIVASVISGYWMGVLNYRFEERQAITMSSSNELAATAVVAWIIFLLARSFRRTPESTRDAGFWALSALGFLYLLIDESFQLHEGMDTAFARLVGSDENPKADGVPTALYGVAAGALCWRFRNEILRYRATLPFFLVGGFFLGATSLLNIGEASSVQIVVEESAKLLGVVSFLLGHLAALAGVIREHALEAVS